MRTPASPITGSSISSVDVIEVQRDPADGTYRTKLILKPSESASPLSFPDLVIAVSDVIP